jgi:hypothetical protein
MGKLHHAVWNSIKKYLLFIIANKRIYILFNKQLIVGGLAGLFTGVAVAEVISYFTKDEFTISVPSGIADYSASILGFLVVYYYDNKRQYLHLPRYSRIRRILGTALSLWPTVVAADIAYLITRPYVHSILLVFGLEAGLAAAVAHFIGVGIFNGTALLSKSIIDYLGKVRGNNVR